MRQLFSARPDLRLAGGLLILLLAVNVVTSPARFVPGNWGTLMGLAAPLVLAALAVTVPFLAGRGSIDVSVGPLMGFINVLLAGPLISGAAVTSPLLIVPVALGLGLMAGAINGFLAVYLRIQPIVATLGMYLFYGGMAKVILPAPAGAVPDWLRALSTHLSILPLAAAAILWLILKRLPYHQALMATGDEDRAAYTAGIDVSRVRFFAYVLGGLFAGLAALSLTGLIGSGDPNIGPPYTLIAIAAAALGGVSLAGGIGGFAAAALGAADIFLLQNLLTSFNVSTFVLQLAYGVILVLAVSLNSDVLKARLAGRWRAVR